MSDYKSKLGDKGFCNWIKASLAISVTKAGMQDVVCNKLELIHRTVLDEVRSEEQKRNNIYCFGCVTLSVVPCSKLSCNYVSKTCPFHKQYQPRPCRNGICDQIRQKICDSHVYRKPSWKNTHAEYWCNSYWEYAKCFMPPDGYLDKKSYDDTDFNGVVNILMNHLDFKREVDICVCENVSNSLWSQFCVALKKATFRGYFCRRRRCQRSLKLVQSISQSL
jgi:hypothetical protein